MQTKRQKRTTAVRLYNQAKQNQENRLKDANSASFPLAKKAGVIASATLKIANLIRLINTTQNAIQQGKTA